MKSETFYFADDVAKIIGQSKPSAFKLIRRLNEELEAKGFLTIKGRVSKKYFHERVYSDGLGC